MSLKIASRKSNLARIQCDIVCNIIEDKFNIKCEKFFMETHGDRRLDVNLSKIGGKGLFVKDIERAILEKKADAAVHSMKDMPFDIPSQFEIAAIPVREDVRDVFVSMNGCSFYDLPKGARIGTSSARRSLQAKMLREDIEIVPIRGNVETRIKKIETEKLDGIILAAAGLKRLNMDFIIKDYFPPEIFIPAIGQGALGVETLKESSNINYFKGIDNYIVRSCVEAERSFMRSLKADCHSMIGAYAQPICDEIYMIGIYETKGKIIKKDIRGNMEDYINIGQCLAKKIIQY
ncbi:MAG: hydroxymethylbilane synthase [Caloramator sp.]|nr:hydroxymethylbilane synthase [Caloramator sp.]